MRISKIIGISVVCYLMITSQLILASSELPKILDYYPSCDYQKGNTITVSRNTSLDKNYHNTTPLILEKLREKAFAERAQAIILLDKKMSPALNPIFKGQLSLRYKAELIHNCNDLSENKEAKAPFNHTGNNASMSWDTAIKTEQIEHTFEKTPIQQRVHLNIKNNLASLTEGVYGVNLGDTLAKLKATLGDPSAEFFLSTNENILGYGRRLWFYLQDDKVVRISTNEDVLQPDILNMISHREFFDYFPWRINGKVKYKDSYESVLSALEMSSQNADKNELVFNAKNSSMSLDFITRNDLYTDEVVSILNGFNIQYNTYSASNVNKRTLTQKQHKSIMSILENLNAGESIDRQKIISMLNQPIGKIWSDAGNQLFFYDNHLILEVSEAKLSKIFLTTKVFVDASNNNDRRWNNNDSGWSFAEFHQGQSMKALKQVVPQGYYEGDNRIDFENDNYQVSLILNSLKAEKTIDSMELVIY